MSQRITKHALIDAVKNQVAEQRPDITKADVEAITDCLWDVIRNEFTARPCRADCRIRDIRTERKRRKNRTQPPVWRSHHHRRIEVGTLQACGAVQIATERLIAGWRVFDCSSLQKGNYRVRNRRASANGREHRQKDPSA